MTQSTNSKTRVFPAFLFIFVLIFSVALIRPSLLLSADEEDQTKFAP